MASGGLKPLEDLLFVMIDGACGGNLSVLFKEDRPDDLDVVTKQKVAFVHLVQGLLAATYAALVNPDTLKNPRQDGMKPIKARKLLDDEMLRDRSLGEVSGWDLQAWHYQITHGTAAPAVIEAFQSWKPVLAKLRNATEAKTRAAEWLDMVASLQLPSLKLRHKSPAA